MPGAIGRLFVTLGMEKKGFDQGAREAKTQTSSLRRSLTDLDTGTDKLTHTLQSLGSAGLMYAAARAAQATWELGKTGATVDRTERSFDRLAGRIGESGDSLLSTMRRVSENTIGDMTLMQTTSGLLASGIKTSTDDIALALDIAQMKAQQFGLTTSEAFERLVTGARKGSVEMLDELGIVIKAESAYRRRAEALGVSVQALTDAQRAEALWKSILEDGQRELETYGGAVLDYGTSFEQAEAAVNNASMALKEALAPAVAEVAGAMAEAIPSLMTTVEQLSILADAGIEWAAAALQGRDAQAEFNATVAEGVGDAQNAARIRLQAAQDLVNELTAERDALLEARAAGVEVYQSHIDMANAELAAAEAARDQAAAALEGAAATAELNAELANTPAAAVAAASGLNIFASAADNWFATYRGIVDKVPEPFKEVWKIIDAEQERLRVNFIRDAVLKSDAEVTAARETEDAWKHAMATQERSLEELRGIVQSALKPTSVTAEDMGLANLGQYVDKWDENARRLEAVAERGFAEIDAHPDWAGMLKIPEGVLAGSEQALKAWARDQAAAVRDLERPDLINIDAAVQAVQDELNRRAAVELSLDLVTQAAIDKGLVTGEDAKDQVAAALGLSQALPVSLTVSDEEKEAFAAGIGTVPVAVTFSTGETEGMEAPGLAEMMDTAVQGISEGWEASLSEIPWMQTLSVAWLADIKASEGRLKEVGAAIGAPLWDGLLGRIRGSGIVNHIVAEVLAALVKETK